MAENPQDNFRIDKWLWAVRIFKTRSIAAAECGKGRVWINGQEAKASRHVRAGDLVVVKKPPVVYTYRVKALLENRIPAKRVEEFLDNLTTKDDLAKLDMIKLTGFNGRDKGDGRPTKKDRRELDKYFN